MTKLQIPKKHRPRQLPTSSCLIRVGAEQYQAVLDICDATGRSITDVSSRLLDFAIKNTEVIEED